jgi:hypothetical protein
MGLETTGFPRGCQVKNECLQVLRAVRQYSQLHSPPGQARRDLAARRPLPPADLVSVEANVAKRPDRDVRRAFARLPAPAGLRVFAANHLGGEQEAKECLLVYRDISSRAARSLMRSQ